MKEKKESSSPSVVIDTPLAATFLTQSQNLRLFSPFLSEEKSVSQAAEAAQVSLLKMYRFVKKAFALELLVQTRSEARQGKPIKYYRASAGNYFVPYGETTQLSFEELYRSSDDALRASLIESLLACFQEAAQASGSTLGLRVFLGDQDQLNLLHSLGPKQSSVMRSFLAADAPAVWSERAMVKLDLETAKSLQHQLYTTVREAAASQEGVPYLLRVALVPVKSEL